jgi:hypothetical protein
MSGWQWFWTLVGFLVYIIVLIFLYFYKPFEVLFNFVVKDTTFDNVIFWAALIAGIVGFCGYHWRAYRIHIVQQKNVEAMVLSSLRGSTFAAILLSGGAALQAVQILCVYLVRQEVVLDAELGKRVAAVLALVVLTGVFCLIFWLLKVMRNAPQSGTPTPNA